MNQLANRTKTMNQLATQKQIPTGLNWLGKGMLQLIFLFYAITLIYPFIWMFLNSLKSNNQFFQNVWSLPKPWVWNNYISAWNEAHIGQYFFNSVMITVIGTFTTVMAAAMPAYVLAKYSFKGSKFIYGLSICSMLIPSIGTLAPWYILMKNLGLFNQLGVVVGYMGGIGFNLIILYSFFKSVSWEYAEAAFMDGAGHFRVFFSIMLPLAKPGLMAVGIISMVGIWNDYLYPYILLQSEKSYTIAVGLAYLIEQQKYASNFTVLFAAMLLSVIPVLLAYFVLQERLINGFTVGGIKG